MTVDKILFPSVEIQVIQCHNTSGLKTLKFLLMSMSYKKTPVEQTNLQVIQVTAMESFGKYMAWGNHLAILTYFTLSTMMQGKSICLPVCVPFFSICLFLIFFYLEQSFVKLCCICTFAFISVMSHINVHNLNKILHFKT